MKRTFVFDPNLTSAVRLAGALDGEITLPTQKEDSTRSLAMIAVARWTQSKSATIAEIEAETGVHRGPIQRWSAIGKALLTSTGGADPVSHDGARDAHTLMRAAGDLPGTTLGKVLTEYKAAYPESGSWAVMAAWASEFIEENAPVESEISEDESEEESEEDQTPVEPKGPLSLEDFIVNSVATAAKKADSEGKKPEDFVRLFAEYAFMAYAAHAEDSIVDGAIVETVGSAVQQAFCAGLVAAAEAVEKAA